MAGSDKTVKVTLVAQTAPFAKGMGDASSATRKLGSDLDDVSAKQKGFAGSASGATKALKGMAIAGAAFAGAALVGFLSESVQAAGDLEQSIGGVDAVFKESAQTVHDFGKTSAESVGLSRNEFNSLITVTGAMLKNKGLEDFTQKSLDLVKVGADLAATYGGSAKDAVEALNAAMRGESDPIEKYGISLNETAVNAELAAKGLGGLTGAALEQAKAQARIDIITRQSADALGAFGREADTLQGQQQRLNAEWEDAKASLGTALLPALTTVMSALRDGVDVVLAVAGAFEDLPAPIKVAAGALIALRLLQGPLGNFFSTTIGQIKTLGTTLKSGGIVSGARAAGSALAGAFGGPFGIAVTVGAAALTYWWEEGQKVNDIAEQIKDTIDKTTGAFTQLSKETIKSALFGDLSTDDIRLLQNLGVNFDALAESALKGGPAFDEQRQKLIKLMDEHQQAGGVFSDEGRAAEGLLRSFERAGAGADRSRLLIGEAGKSVKQTGDAMAGVGDLMAGAFDGVGKAAQDAIPDIDTLSIRQGVLAEAADIATQAHKDLAKAVRGISDAAVDADQAEADWQQAIDDVTAAIDKNGKTADKTRTQLDLNTDAGRKNQDALIGLRDAAVDNATAMLTQGDSVDKVKDKMGDARQKFIDAARDMGLNKDSAAKLADQYGITEGSVDDLKDAIEETPQETKAKITAETSAAKTAISGIDAMLNALDGRTITVGVTAATRSAVTSINNVGSLFGWKKAEGGYISGPGTATSDSIPALLSNGEYVIKAAAVAKYGKAQLDAMNAMRFAGGGFVSRMSAPSAAPGFDMDQLVSALGDRVTVNVQANDPARAARQVVAELEWRAVNG